MKRILGSVVLSLALGLCGAAGAVDAPTPAVQVAATPVTAAMTVEQAEETARLDTGSTAWMIAASVLVMLMTIPGLALFYGGLVRAKNMLSILMQVFMTFSLVSVLWALYAYSLAFSPGTGLNAVIGGLDKAFLAGIGPDTLTGAIPEYVFVVFQMTFAAITPALIVGGFAERMKFSAVLWFMGLWVTLVYAPIVHMVWGGGWLAQLGARDFAGGTVVHINAGVAALVGCLVLGRRVGYPREAMPPHSLTMTMTGASLLWVGWFGFNVGSELAVDGIAGMVLVNTQIATAAAALGWVFIEWVVKGMPSMLGAVSGAVAGLVAITPACGFVGPMGAMILGIVAGMVCFWAVTGLKSMFGYDDTLDVFGVHCIGGIVGAIGTGFLMAPDLGGVGYPEGVTMMGQVARQAVACGTTLVWSGAISFVLYKFVDAIVGLRPSEEEEREGLDIHEHGERAYHL